LGCGLAYPQLFPHHNRRTDEAHEGTEWGKKNSENRLRILNDHWIGPKNQYLCGDQIAIADYCGAGIVTLGELIRCDLSKYPNVERWLNNMKKLSHWNKVNGSPAISASCGGNVGEFIPLPQ
jgi:glutathione S-transferase